MKICIKIVISKYSIIFISAFKSPLLDIGIPQVSPQISIFSCSMPTLFLLIYVVSPAFFFFFLAFLCIPGGSRMLCVMFIDYLLSRQCVLPSSLEFTNGFIDIFYFSLLTYPFCCFSTFPR